MDPLSVCVCFKKITTKLQIHQCLLVNLLPVAWKESFPQFLQGEEYVYNINSLQGEAGKSLLLYNKTHIDSASTSPLKKNKLNNEKPFPFRQNLCYSLCNTDTVSLLR